jgi:chromate reductase, NAD(P)H dehydrogenase (quinone)
MLCNHGVMPKTITVLGIAGSLRRDSFNRATLRAAKSLAPEGVSIEIFELNGIPVYNQDEESNPPARVVELKARVRAADAILIATPEYNYSFAGVLKNAIDWASRPYGDSAWADKPVALMSASVGRFGGARAQYHLRQSMVTLNMHPVNTPEVMISEAANAFDAQGNLKDESAKRLIRELLTNLAEWTIRLSNPTARQTGKA